MITNAAHQAEATATDLRGLSLELQKRYEASTSADDRKQRGQFFTPPLVAKFMAGLFSTFPKRFKVLDPGAGTGTLSASICERILRLRSPRDIDLQLLENDPGLVPLLDENMKYSRSVLRQAGHNMSYTIHQADFILCNAQCFGQQTLFDTRIQLDKFDAVIMNPPYFKITKSSEYAQMMNRIVHGQPNMYALFMALAAEMLRPGGELVAITPRSFCNGLYFRGFRRWFFDRMCLKHVHLFDSRTETFRDANVLQESVITLTQRQSIPPATVTISSSFGRDLSRKPVSLPIATNKLIDDTCGDKVVRIPANSHDARIITLVESWPTRFADLGLRVSTGPVVMFRAREFLLAVDNGQKTAPLLCVHNVRPFETVWPIHKKNKPTGFKVRPDSLRLLLPTRNYVLLRRFSAKEERRRLTASCFLKCSETRPYIALENHLNYVYHAHRELTADEVYGIAALFNSALLDRYFRTISGNTQVNATELRTMKFPDLGTVVRIGRHIKRLSTFVTGKAEHIVLEELSIHGTLVRYLTELAL